MGLFTRVFAFLDSEFDLKKQRIIMGDFNSDYSQIKMLPSFLKSKYSLEQSLDSFSSNYGTILDHIYTNIDKSMINSCGVL